MEIETLIEGFRLFNSCKGLSPKTITWCDAFLRHFADFLQHHRLARPYRKNEQAFVESFHRTLRKECLGWCKYRLNEMEELQKEAREYLEYYHYERSHLGLDMRTPLPPISCI